MHTPIRRLKASRRLQKGGFTLIEILVVMAIIGILAAISFSAATQAINAAKRLKDSSTAMQIKTAVINYQTEYGCLPIPTGATPGNTDLIIPAGAPGGNPGASPTAAMINFYNGLSGNLNAYNPTVALSSTITGINTKNIAYLNLQKASVDANGCPVQAFPASGYNGTSSAASPNNYTYFFVELDSNYDGVISGLPDPTFATNGTGGGQFGGATTESCAVWCNNDQTFGTVTPRWSKTY